jgi:RND family efflux transporter MFP subunit
MTTTLNTEVDNGFRAENGMSSIQSEAHTRHVESKHEGPGITRIVVMATFALAVALIVGVFPRWRQTRELNAATAQSISAPPRVNAIVAGQMPSNPDRVLPGNALPLLEASLYARTTGYLKRRLVDIGDRVTEGQLLAEISAPDIDDQLAQAKASLEQARANLKLAEANAVLAKTTLARVENANVGLPGTITKQEIDQDRATVATTAATVETAKATILSNEATVQRYLDLQSFQRITAPFPGVITARNIDPGDLVTADNPSSKELFHLMRTDILRVFVNVPQAFSQGIKIDQDAVLYRRENPDKRFAGKVTRTADALDPSTRTLLTEVQVPNPDDALRPGMYIQVKLDHNRIIVPVVIPTAALATRTGEPRVAVLDDQHRVRYHTVRLGRDYGAEIAVLGGLDVGDMIVIHPGDDLPEGTIVDPIVDSASVPK